MAAASGSSASHGFPQRLRPGLPLIPCGKCRDETKIVMEYYIYMQIYNDRAQKGRLQ